MASWLLKDELKAKDFIVAGIINYEMRGPSYAPRENQGWFEKGLFEKIKECRPSYTSNITVGQLRERFKLTEEESAL